MEQQVFSKAVIESEGDPVKALQTLLEIASGNVEAKTWSRWLKAKRDFSLDEQALARWLTAKLEFINGHKGIDTISFEASWQADEEGDEGDNEPTAAAFAIFTGTTFNKKSGVFEATGDSLEEFAAGYYYIAREMRDISDESTSTERADWIQYEDEKYMVTGGSLAGLLVRVLGQLPLELLLGSERQRFFPSRAAL